MRPDRWKCQWCDLDSYTSDSGGGDVDQDVWSTLAGRTDRQLAELVALNHADLLLREARVLLLAAAWADTHDVDTHTSLQLTPLPPGADLTAARPRVVLHLHLSDATVRNGRGLVRPEHGDPLTLGQLRDFLTGTGCVVQVRPVLDPAHLAPVDGYETPARIREAMRLRHPTEVFPYGSASVATVDLDHTVPYLPPARGGPPGQTGLDNLGPLSRPAHRAVTSGRWQRRKPEPGRFLFRSPAGYVFLVTNQGTQALGCGGFAKQVWRAAARARAGVAVAA